MFQFSSQRVVDRRVVVVVVVVVGAGCSIARRACVSELLVNTILLDVERVLC